MAKRPDRPVRVEYWGVVHGSGPEATQVLEMRVTTPKRSYTNGFQIGTLPPLEEGEKRTLAQAAFAKAQLYLSQRVDVREAVSTARTHLAGVRYTEAVEKLVSEMAEPEKEAAAIEALTVKLEARSAELERG